MLITYNIDYIKIHNIIITTNTIIQRYGGGVYTRKLFSDGTFCLSASSEQKGVHTSHKMSTRQAHR